MKGNTHDLTFSAHTIDCVCHSIRSMFRVLGIYNFVCHTDSWFPTMEIRIYKIRMFNDKPLLISVDRSLLSYCTVICIRRTPLPKAAKGSFFQKVLMHLSSFPTYEPNCFPEIFKLASKAQPSCPYKSLSCQILKHSIFLSTFQSLLKLIVKFQFGLYVWRYDKFISTFWKKLTLQRSYWSFSIILYEKMRIGKISSKLLKSLMKFVKRVTLNLEGWAEQNSCETPTLFLLSGLVNLTSTE